MSASEASAGSLVPREPGWTLLGGSDAAGGLWHRVAWRRYDGMLFAACGASGRFVDEANHEIICCSACGTAAPPS